MKTTPSQLMVGLSLLAVVSASAFASDPTPVSASSSYPSIAQQLLQGYSYQSKTDQPDPEPVVAPVVALGGADKQAQPTLQSTEVAKEVPFKTDRKQIKDSPDRQFRAVSDAMAFSDPTTPHALYTKDLTHNLQFEAIGGPIPPFQGEDAIHGEQPRFPLIGLNW